MATAESSQSESVRVDFFDPDVNECPYPAYQRLRDDAPVWRDPATGQYLITRYVDVRAILLDKTGRFSNQRPSGATRRGLLLPDDPKSVEAEDELADRAEQLYEEKGFLPEPNLDALDEPGHMQRRRLFDHVFRPAAVKELDPLIGELAHKLIDAFVEDGRCEWVSQFAVPLPLMVIGRVVGVPDEELPYIKRWTDAIVARISLTQSGEELLSMVELDIEMQHYFCRHFDQLRKSPNDTFLSTLVNTDITELGRPMTDQELFAEMGADLFVGGAETTTNALSHGVMLLIEHPEVWQAVKADPENMVPRFAEEVLRLEAPVQSLRRVATVDIELHGVTIPAGALINLRYGAANRDERAFECPESINLERKNPRSHLAFGTGAHVCLGAPLARRELYLSFHALVDRVDELRFIDGVSTFEHPVNYSLRGLKQLQVEFSTTLAV